MQELHGIGNDIQDLIYKKLTALKKSLYGEEINLRKQEIFYFKSYHN
jgi:hypothetical protein